MIPVNFLDLGTGLAYSVVKGDIRGDVVARIAPWLGAMIEADKYMPVPYLERACLSASAGATGGCVLHVSIREPGLDISVARTEQHAAKLWDYLLKGLPGAPVAEGVTRPPAPWCITSAWPRFSEQPPETVDWLAQLTREIAWVWVNHEVCYKPPTRGRGAASA